MKWIVVVLMIVNDQPTRVVLSQPYDNIGDCNYEMMRQVFQLHTAQWKITCEVVK